MSRDRDPAPVASLESLTMTQRGDLEEALNKIIAAGGVVLHAAIVSAFLRGVASERDRSAK